MEGGHGEPPEPHCAWYSPIHFFGHGWGIYIRERCVLDVAADVAAFVDWSQVDLSSTAITQQLLRSAFYVFFLHEQFHHKVESLGLRLLVATDSDRYRPYKAKVYRPTFLTSACLEESLANAESLRRLDEPRYVRRIAPAIHLGLRQFLRAAIALQPAGYREGLNFVREDEYRAGRYKLQSQILDASLMPRTPDASWSVAPNMITALADISDSIYVVLPKGGAPNFHAHLGGPWRDGLDQGPGRCPDQALWLRAGGRRQRVACEAEEARRSDDHAGGKPTCALAGTGEARPGCPRRLPDLASGAKTPHDSLKGLCVYLAEGDAEAAEVQPPPSPRKY